jgi:hypothetical protein
MHAEKREAAQARDWVWPNPQWAEEPRALAPPTLTAAPHLDRRDVERAEVLFKIDARLDIHQHVDDALAIGGWGWGGIGWGGIGRGGIGSGWGGIGWGGAREGSRAMRQAPKGGNRDCGRGPRPPATHTPPPGTPHHSRD